MAQSPSLLTVKRRGLGQAQEWALFGILLRGVYTPREALEILAFLYPSLPLLALLAAYVSEASSTSSA
jgi:hypothetical protein